MYVWVACRYYFVVRFIDAFSRYVVHHRLLVDLNGASVSTELEAALAKAGQVRPRIVHDHGSEYVNRDMRAVIKQHNVLDIRTWARHPESNGIVERFNGTVRDETSDRALDSRPPHSVLRVHRSRTGSGRPRSPPQLDCASLCASPDWRWGRCFALAPWWRPADS